MDSVCILTANVDVNENVFRSARRYLLYRLEHTDGKYRTNKIVTSKESGYNRIHQTVTYLRY